MPRTSADSEQLKRRRLWIQLALVVAAIAFVLLRPRMEAWLEARKSPQPVPPVNEPTVDAATDEVPQGNGPRSDAESVQPMPDETDDDLIARRTAAESNDQLIFPDPAPAGPTEQPAKTKPPASDPPKTESAKVDARKNKTETTEAASEKTPLGQLTEIRRDVFESTAGLIYGEGSVHGNRLQHVLEHAVDDTSKPKHGVFDGDRDTILAVIDEAFEKSKSNSRDVRTEDQNDRTVITVNLKRRIGFAGGQEGQRQKKPLPCNYLRLVVENDVEVVTAYPTRSF